MCLFRLTLNRLLSKSAYKVDFLWDKWLLYKRFLLYLIRQHHRTCKVRLVIYSFILCTVCHVTTSHGGAYKGSQRPLSLPQEDIHRQFLLRGCGDLDLTIMAAAISFRAGPSLTPRVAMISCKGKEGERGSE